MSFFSGTKRYPVFSRLYSPFSQEALVPFIGGSYLLFNSTLEALAVFPMEKTLAQSGSTLGPD